MEEEQRQLGFMATFARAWHRSPGVPKGFVAGGDTLGEIAFLAPQEALHRLLGTGKGLTSDEVEARLRSVGLNQITHQTRHTIVGELVSRSINPLNMFLLTIATASYLSGHQRVAIVIAVMVALSVSLGFIPEHRSNKAADLLRRMVLIATTVRRKIPHSAKVHDEVPIEQLVPGDIVLLSAGHARSDPTCTPRCLSPQGDWWFWRWAIASCNKYLVMGWWQSFLRGWAKACSMDFSPLVSASLLSKSRGHCHLQRCRSQCSTILLPISCVNAKTAISARRRRQAIALMARTANENPPAFS